MKRRPEKDPAQTHFAAAQIHRALARSGLTIAQLAVKIGQSERFIRQLLQGENGVDHHINLALLKKIANATGETLTIKVFPDRGPKSPIAVK